MEQWQADECGSRSGRECYSEASAGVVLWQSCVLFYDLIWSEENHEQL
jgi:hypothetical protein